MALNRRKEPCPECPWRRDTPPGQFPAERYEALRGTSRGPAGHPGLDAPMFACHKSGPQCGQEVVCAGWLAVEGRDHVRIRIAAAKGELPAEALSPAEGWPELHTNYEDMAADKGRQDGP